VTEAQRKARGIAAAALLNDQTIQEAWVELENELRAQWEACWLPRKRDRLWNELRHVRALRKKLASYAGHAPRD
jgi:hypothetical protein